MVVMQKQVLILFFILVFPHEQVPTTCLMLSLGKEQETFSKMILTVLAQRVVWLTAPVVAFIIVGTMKM